ncbi:MAG: hypothetical protein HNEKOMLI_00256 [Sodalis sp. Psp]|nr:hypothetical protein [Sodalis sp. Psp]MCR3756753.1 hypothetical protein [Sodalis sp. Ppy]
MFSSNATNLPEVIGCPEDMFDPHNITAIRDIIMRELTDNDYYKKL